MAPQPLRLTRWAALLSLVASGAAAQAPDPIATYADSVVGAAIAKHQTAGASVAIVKAGRTIVSKGYGSQDLENDVPATAQTVYRIGSLTKQFTAAAIMRLAEQGKLSLDDSVQKFLPTFPTQGNRVTIRHLLTHTSGIKSYTGLGPKWTSRMRLDLAKDSLVAMFANEPFDFKPGAQWKYDNSGYFLLGMIIERLSGQSYGAYLKDEFFTPLGLAGTRYCDQRPLITHRAQGYSPTPDGQFVNADLLSMTQPYAAGSLCSTVDDLAAWTRALSSGKVVSPASYAQMTTPGTLNDGAPLTYGFGLQVGTLAGHRHIYHNGGINGFISELHHYPDDSLIVVVLTNTEGPAAPKLEAVLARRALGIPEAVVKDVALRAADVARFSGDYVLGGQLAIKVFADGAALKAQAAGQSALLLRYQGGATFVADADHDITLEFATGDPSPSFVLTQNGKRTATRKR